MSSNNETVEVVAKINEIYSIDSLIALLAKVCECFEFLIDREIYVDRIVYSDFPKLRIKKKRFNKKQTTQQNAGK